MPVRNRKTENLLQFILGALICLALVYAALDRLLALFGL
jgi:hypothetical protein